MTEKLPDGIDPKHLKLTYVPGGSRPGWRELLFSPLSPRYEIVPAVEADACAAGRGCALCAPACPQQAIAVGRDAAAISRAKCTGCAACLSACPAGAIRHPLLDPERLEAELRALLPGRQAAPEPGIFLLVADGGPLPRRPERLRGLCLPSAGAVSAWLLLRAFTLGADGVAVLPCGPGCRHGCDQARWERTLSFARGVLDRVGVEAGRLLVVERAGVERRLEAFAGALATAGPSPLRSRAGQEHVAAAHLAEVLEELAAAAPVPPASLAGEAVPFGMVSVRADRCTLCGACPERCPTGALTLHEDEGSSRLLFTHARCAGCEVCVQVCPERAVEVERRLEFSKLRAPLLLAEDRVARCPRCEVPVAPESLLRRVGRSGSLCPECRIFAAL